MHLKRVTLCNFKSYLGTTIIEDLPQGITAFVGKNGAGKSNIFQAIEFVFAHTSKTIGWRDLQCVLSSRNTDGYVELELENSDPVFDGNISLRKTFSRRDCGKITFFMNGKEVDQKTFLNILQRCGFQFYQPFFVINHRLVKKFTQLSPAEKMDYMLKNMGAVFNETYKIIGNLFKTFEDQQGLISHLHEICKIERNDMKEKYLSARQVLNESKLCIIYHICKRNITDFQKKKLEFESQLQRYSKVVNVKENIREMKNKLWEISQFIATQEDAIEDMCKEKTDVISKNERISLKLVELNDELKFLQQNASFNKGGIEFDKEKYLVTEQIINVEKMLNEQISKCTDLKNRLDAKEVERLYILEKNKRYEEFPDKSMHQDWFQAKIRSLNEQKTTLKEDIKKLSEAESNYLDKKRRLEQQVKDILKTDSAKDEVIREISSLKIKLANLQNDLSVQRMKEHSIQTESDCISKSIQEAKFKLEKKVGKSMIKGADSVLWVIDYWRSLSNEIYNKYYGLVIDRITATDGLALAIETAVGTRLFSHVVIDHSVGTEILKEMKNNNLPGEAWFVPIKGLRFPQYDYANISELAEPLLSKLEYPEVMENVMKFLFGGVMIAPDLETATRVVRQSGLTCVTVQGDRVSSKCDLYGGYLNPNKCSWTIFQELKKLSLDSDSKEDALTQVKNDISLLENDIVNTTSTIQKLKTILNSTDKDSKIKRVKGEIHTIEEELSTLNQRLSGSMNSVRQVEDYMKVLEKENDEDFHFDSVECSHQLEYLNQEISQLKRGYNESKFQIFEMKQEKIKLEDSFHSYEKKELINNSEIIAIKRCRDHIKEAEYKKSLINNRLDTLKGNIENVEASILVAENSKLKITELLDKLLDKKIELSGEHIEKARIVSKINYYDYKISANYSLLRDLQKKYNATINHPNDYDKLSTQVLKKKLNNIKEDLKNLEENYLQNNMEASSIPVKVLERFGRLENNFARICVCFSRYIDLFHEFVEAKIESISEVFSDLFQKMTGGMEGFLIADDDGSSRHWPALPNITGINTFIGTSDTEGTWDLKALSFGQQICTLLALSLSFCTVTSVPFFVIDEVSMSLSPEEQRRLHDMIQSFGAGVQIFTSTHSMEAASNIPSIYNVFFDRMGSHVLKLPLPTQEPDKE